MLSDTECLNGDCGEIILKVDLRRGAKYCRKTTCKKLRTDINKANSSNRAKTEDRATSSTVHQEEGNREVRTQASTESFLHEQRATTSFETTARIEETKEHESSVEHIRTTTQVDNGRPQIELKKVEVNCFI